MVQPTTRSLVRLALGLVTAATAVLPVGPGATADDSPAVPTVDVITVGRVFPSVTCRAPDAVAYATWIGAHLTDEQLRLKLDETAEGQRVRMVRQVYLSTVGRDPMRGDCAGLRDWVDSPNDINGVNAGVGASPEALRAAEVRAAFQEALGRDPAGDDNTSLRRWMATPLTGSEIAGRLRAQRPLIGVHYFPWYRPSPQGWGNGATVVRPSEGRPNTGFYDSSDPAVVDQHIKQMEAAGFDFAIINLPPGQPQVTQNTSLFFERLQGHKLKAAVMLDGLFTYTSADKTRLVQDAVSRFTVSPSYLQVDGLPVIYLHASPVADLQVPSVTLKNLYWTFTYAQGHNTFNQRGFLYPEEAPFWSTSPQQVINGVVPVIPGYTDKHLGRSFSMDHPRDNGALYKAQWERALALHPDTIMVYSWNEHFEETAIEPTDTWGDQYLRLTACYVALAQQGAIGSCS